MKDLSHSIDRLKPSDRDLLVAQVRYPIRKEVDHRLNDFLFNEVNRAIVHPVFFALERVVPQLRETVDGSDYE